VHDGGVKRATAVRHVREMAEESSGLLRLRETEIGWPLEELWAAGELLGDREAIEAGTVVLMVDVPPEELPWLVVHPVAEWVGERLGLGKRPFHWFYRPVLWPAWNPAHRRVARVWTAGDGVDAAALDALSTGGFDGVVVAEPTATEAREQFGVELVAARRHLHEILECYWDRDWRAEHRQPQGPEDHLWRSAQGVREIEAAIGASP
jgi:hypothetical protein